MDLGMALATLDWNWCMDGWHTIVRLRSRDYETMKMVYGFAFTMLSLMAVRDVMRVDGLAVTWEFEKVCSIGVEAVGAPFQSSHAHHASWNLKWACRYFVLGNSSNISTMRSTVGVIVVYTLYFPQFYPVRSQRCSIKGERERIAGPSQQAMRLRFTPTCEFESST
jgi:hypothetical protein